MTEEENYYYQVFLEVAKKGEETVFGFINISHIPYAKFEELFQDQITCLLYTSDAADEL